MEQLMEILTNMRPDVDFASETALISDSILSSFDIVYLVSMLNETFDIEITTTHLVPENFETPQAMLALIEKLQDE